ncbi:MAG: UDP-N-acetylmuramate dehydrogenase, partial [Planctomycetota bacterium]
MRSSSLSSLFGDLDVEAEHDVQIGAQTWYGIGGRADLLLRPRSVDALATLVHRCHRSGTPLNVLGSGANVLVADEGVNGVVVRLDLPAFKTTDYNPEGEVEAVLAMAGVDLARLLMDTARRGLEGLSHMAGIPATVGGALRMNAGGAFGEIGDTVRRVTCISRRGEIVSYPASEIDFEYRSTNIPDPIIVSGVFDLTPTDPIALRNRIKEIFAFKKSSQPMAEHSAGCAFKNPMNPVTEKRVSAGKLIDEVGLKGHRVGGATISERHANFITVIPGATAKDVLDLMDLARDRVFDHCGLLLEREVVVLSRD